MLVYNSLCVSYTTSTTGNLQHMPVCAEKEASGKAIRAGPVDGTGGGDGYFDPLQPHSEAAAW